VQTDLKSFCISLSPKQGETPVKRATESRKEVSGGALKKVKIILAKKVKGLANRRHDTQKRKISL
jgi:hypothetical protein